MILIDGKKEARLLREELKKEVSDLKAKYNKVPGLTVILIGDLTPSQIYVRNKEKSANEVGLKSDVLKYTVEEIEKVRKIDLVVIVEENYPFRPKELLTKLINNIIEGGYDTVCASIIEQRSIWLDAQQGIHAIGDSLMGSRRTKPEKIHINLFGLGAVTYVDNIRKKTILTNKVGLSPVPNYQYSFQINKDV